MPNQEVSFGGRLAGAVLDSLEHMIQDGELCMEGELNKKFKTRDTAKCHSIHAKNFGSRTNGLLSRTGAAGA